MVENSVSGWLRMRRWFYINVCLGAYLYGVSLTIYYPTEYYYFKTTLKVTDPNFYYGMSWACLCGSGIVGGIVGAYYVDKTRNIRELCIFINLVSVIGNIMYVIYISPLFVLCGQILIGAGAARNVAGIGEIPRIFENDKITHVISVIGLYSTLGLVTGPCLIFAFQYVHWHMIYIDITIANVPGAIMAVAYMLQLILNVFTLQNVSKIYNVKKEKLIAEQSLTDQQLDEKSTKPDTEPKVHDPQIKSKDSYFDSYVFAMKVAAQSKHILFLFLLSFFGTLASCTVTLLEPIESVTYLNWDQINLNIYISVSLLIGGIPSVLLLVLLSKYVNDFYIFVATFVSSFLPLLLMGSFPLVVKYFENSLATFYFYSIGTTKLVYCILFQSISKVLLAKFVPESIQTISEAIRNSLFELSYMVAGLMVKISTWYVSEVMYAMAILMFLAFLWTLTERKSFKDARAVQVFENSK